MKNMLVNDVDCVASILDLVDMHNDHVDKMNVLAKTLLDTYPNVEDTSVDKAFGDAFNSIIAMAIWLCCEMNSMNNGPWKTTEDWHVVREEMVEG